MSKGKGTEKQEKEQARNKIPNGDEDGLMGCDRWKSKRRQNRI